MSADVVGAPVSFAVSGRVGVAEGLGLLERRTRRRSGELAMRILAGSLATAFAGLGAGRWRLAAAGLAALGLAVAVLRADFFLAARLRVETVLFLVPVSCCLARRNAFLARFSSFLAFLASSFAARRARFA